MNIFKNINISSIANNTSNILNLIKKGIPVYKEIKPLLKKENKFLSNNLNFNEIKKESNSEYNNSLTFFK